MGATLLPGQAQALTHTSVSAAFPVTFAGNNGKPVTTSGTISGSFDYDGTANSSSNITNFSSIEVSPLQFNGPSTPVFAGYTGATASSGNLGFTVNQGSLSSTQRVFFLIENIRLTNTPETIHLIGLNSGLTVRSASA